MRTNEFNIAYGVSYYDGHGYGYTYVGSFGDGCSGYGFSYSDGSGSGIEYK